MNPQFIFQIIHYYCISGKRKNIHFYILILHWFWKIYKKKHPHLSKYIWKSLYNYFTHATINYFDKHNNTFHIIHFTCITFTYANFIFLSHHIYKGQRTLRHKLGSRVTTRSLAHLEMVPKLDLTISAISSPLVHTKQQNPSRL